MKDIESFIDVDPDKFRIIMDLFFNGDKTEAQRAAYIMSNVAMHNETLLTPYIERLIENLYNCTNDTIIRNSVRLFQYINPPESSKGKLINKCFEYLEDLNSAIAIRAFSMTVLFKNLEDIPELLEELKLVIELNMVNGSAGIQSRGKNILKALNKKL